MKQPVSIIICIFLSGILGQACAPLEEYELFPELTRGEWEIVSIEFADQRPADSCEIEMTLVFGQDGSFERNSGCPDSTGFDIVEGSWKYQRRRDIIQVQEQFRSGRGGRGVMYRRYDLTMVQDTLWMEELWEEGNDLYRLERR